MLVVVELAQGLIGFVQYFTDLPIVLVEFHLLGAAVLAATLTWTLLQVREASSRRPLRRRRSDDRDTQVLAVLDEIEALGVRAWVDGGWGVDALLAEETREHDDLDLVVEDQCAAHGRRAARDRGLRDRARPAPDRPRAPASRWPGRRPASGARHARRRR